MKDTETGTTEIIRRRIKHWKTSIAGIVCLAAPLALAVFPEHSERISALVAAASGIGLLAAADAKKPAATP